MTTSLTLFKNSIFIVLSTQDRSRSLVNFMRRNSHRNVVLKLTMIDLSGPVGSDASALFVLKFAEPLQP